MATAIEEFFESYLGMISEGESVIDVNPANYLKGTYLNPTYARANADQVRRQAELREELGITGDIGTFSALVDAVYQDFLPPKDLKTEQTLLADSLSGPTKNFFRGLLVTCLDDPAILTDGVLAEALPDSLDNSPRSLFLGIKLEDLGISKDKYPTFKATFDKICDIKGIDVSQRAGILVGKDDNITHQNLLRIAVGYANNSVDVTSIDEARIDSSMKELATAALRIQRAFRGANVRRDRVPNTGLRDDGDTVALGGDDEFKTVASAVDRDGDGQSTVASAVDRDGDGQSTVASGASFRSNISGRGQGGRRGFHGAASELSEEGSTRGGVLDARSGVSKDDRFIPGGGYGTGSALSEDDRSVSGAGSGDDEDEERSRRGGKGGSGIGGESGGGLSGDRLARIEAKIDKILEILGVNNALIAELKAEIDAANTKIGNLFVQIQAKLDDPNFKDDSKTDPALKSYIEECVDKLRVEKPFSDVPESLADVLEIKGGKLKVKDGKKAEFDAKDKEGLVFTIIGLMAQVVDLQKERSDLKDRLKEAEAERAKIKSELGNLQEHKKTGQEDEYPKIVQYSELSDVAKSVVVPNVYGGSGIRIGRDGSLTALYEGSAGADLLARQVDSAARKGVDGCRSIFATIDYGKGAGNEKYCLVTVDGHHATKSFMPKEVAERDFLEVNANLYKFAEKFYIQEQIVGDLISKLKSIKRHISHERGGGIDFDDLDRRVGELQEFSDRFASVSSAAEMDAIVKEIEGREEGGDGRNKLTLLVEGLDDFLDPDHMDALETIRDSKIASKETKDKAREFAQVNFSQHLTGVVRETAIKRGAEFDLTEDEARSFVKYSKSVQNATGWDKAVVAAQAVGLGLATGLTALPALGAYYHTVGMGQDGELKGVPRHKIDKILEAPSPDAVEGGISISENKEDNTVCVSFNGNSGDDIAYVYLPNTDNCYVKVQRCDYDGEIPVWRDGKLVDEYHKKGEVVIHDTIVHRDPDTGKEVEFNPHTTDGIWTSPLSQQFGKEHAGSIRRQFERISIRATCISDDLDRSMAVMVGGKICDSVPLPSRSAFLAGTKDEVATFKVVDPATGIYQRVTEQGGAIVDKDEPALIPVQTLRKKPPLNLSVRLNSKSDDGKFETTLVFTGHDGKPMLDADGNERTFTRDNLKAVMIESKIAGSFKEIDEQVDNRLKKMCDRIASGAGVVFVVVDDKGNPIERKKVEVARTLLKDKRFTRHEDASKALYDSAVAPAISAPALSTPAVSGAAASAPSVSGAATSTPAASTPAKPPAVIKGPIRAMAIGSVTKGLDSTMPGADSWRNRMTRAAAGGNTSGGRGGGGATAG